MGNQANQGRRDKSINLHATEEVFESPEQMSAAIEALVHYLNTRYSKKNDPYSGVLGFIIENIRVEFSPNVKTLQIVSNFGQGSATILAPDDKGSQENREERRAELLRLFFPTLKDAQLRATIQLYRTLQAEARKSLISRFCSTEEDAVAPPRPEHPRNVILVVDDDPDYRAMIVGLLEIAGYQTVEARSGQAAITLLQGNFSPNLIVLDISMPEMDGRQFCHKVQEDQRLSKIPIIIHTSLDISPEELTSLGAKGYTLKSPHPNKLITMIPSILKSAEA